jgi:hypothetical protein
VTGSRRIAVGGFLLLIGVGLVVGGALVGNVTEIGFGGLLFLAGLGAVLWGAVAGAAEWWESWRHRPSRASTYPRAAPIVPTNYPAARAPPPPPPPSRPLVAVPKRIPSSTIDTPRLAHKSDPQLTAVSSFLAQYRPSERFGREGEFEVELAQALRGRFGNAHVLRQVPVGEGRIDIQVFGIGLELKIAGSSGSLLRLTDQVADYRDHYGPNLIVVILDDTGGNEQVSNLRRFLASQGVQVLLK